jgi:16S rRNA (cytosine967-C5)-methyltransferase
MMSEMPRRPNAAAKLVNARDFALILLDKKRLPGWNENPVRERKPSAPRDPRDRALAEQIVNGVVKNLLLLRNTIEHYSGKSLAGIDPVVQKILAIGLFQLKFLDRIPASAAVNQAVEQTKTFGRRRASGFVNAVLRNVERQAAPAVPDVNVDPEGYAELALSHPRELFRRLVALLGAERALAFCRHDNAEPPMILRLFKGVTPADLLEDAEAIEFVPHELPGLLVVRGARGTILAHWAKLGLAQVQDATAAGVVEKMRITTGLRVLDRCAGLGTKTMQIQERVGPKGEVVAVDSSMFRTVKLQQLLRDRGIPNVCVIHGSKLSEIGENISGLFDRILIDVPCSNSGVLARRPEARYRFAVDSVAKVQRNILDDTLGRLASGGLLVYSTCSVWPEENELQIRDLLSRNPGFELVEERSILPSFDETAPEKYHDGGYFAVIGKQWPQGRNSGL